MIIIPILFISLAYFIHFCSNQKLDYDYKKHILDKNKDNIQLFEFMSNNFTEKEIEEFIEIMKK